MTEPERVDAQLERLGELIDEISTLNGLELGVTDPKDVVRLFRMADTTARYPTAMIRDGLIIDVNHLFEETFGYNRSDVVGRPATDFVPEDERETVAGRVDEREPEAYETRVLCADGSKLRVWVRPERIGPFRFSSAIPLEGDV